MQMNIPLDILGIIYVIWILAFWASYMPLRNRLRSAGRQHLPLALLVQFFPPIGLIFLLILLWFCLKQDHDGGRLRSNAMH